jgi:hypothetical protein
VAKYYYGSGIKEIAMSLGEERDVYRMLARKPRKWPLGRPRRRWEDNIKRGLKKQVVRVGSQ